MWTGEDQARVEVVAMLEGERLFTFAPSVG